MNPPPIRSDVHPNHVPPLGNPANPPPPMSFLPRASTHSVPPSLPLSNQPGLQVHNTYPHQPPGMMPTQGPSLHLTQGVGGPSLPYRDQPNQYGQQMNTNMLPVNGYKMPHQNPRSGNMVPPPSSAHDHYHQPRNSRNQPPSRPQPFHQLPGQPNLALPPRPMLSYVETSVNEPIPHKASTFHNNLHQPNMPPNALYGPHGVLNGASAPAPMLPQSSIASINHNHREFDRPPRDTYIPGGGQDGYSNNMRNGNGNGSRNQNDRRYNRNNNNNNNNYNSNHGHNNNNNNNNVNGRDRWTPSTSNQAPLNRQRGGDHRNRQNDGRRGGSVGGGNRQSWPMNSFNNGNGGGNGDYMQGGSQRSDGDWNNSSGPPPPPPHPHPHPHPHHQPYHPSHSHSSSNGIEPSVPLIRYAGRPQDDGPHLEY
ncbi:uncharacterized protein MELLADRAFT_94825 [Melampsora larici-populina 98AG31]|uniref:Uncharacterized protein n=1 Tax=Melampsora larici-populina (strain 98AG31 / pathotype 3-4-7) TaxID=747676 RepID=F4S823_MELLP|nr:uncharacterized protein MELLADRAFT_94825 [Melampsora larici-populina 98AG31]EGF99229.1 hypothetical protein MELLADRAFT_94825 [Melampsora larici-populina 98AG31]